MDDQDLIELRLGLVLKDLMWNLKVIEFPSIIVVREEKDMEFRLKYKNDKIMRLRNVKPVEENEEIDGDKE